MAPPLRDGRLPAVATAHSPIGQREDGPPRGGACRSFCGNLVSQPSPRSTDVPVVSSSQLHQSILSRVRLCLARGSYTWVKTLSGSADTPCQLFHRKLNDPGCRGRRGPADVGPSAAHSYGQEAEPASPGHSNRCKAAMKLVRLVLRRGR